MEESQEILFNSLHNSGVSIPPNVVSIRDLTPASLFSICAHCLNLIDNMAAFPTSLPDSTAEKVKICTEIASRIKNLGYIGDMSFHKFLYPSEEDLYKLVRFLVERLSETSEDGKTAEVKDRNNGRRIEEGEYRSSLEEWTEKAENEGIDLNNQKVEAKLKDLRLRTEVAGLLDARNEDVFASKSYDAHLIPRERNEVSVVDIPRSGTRDLSGNDLGMDGGKDLVESSADLRRNAFRVEETAANSLELLHLEEELELLKAAGEMAFDDQHFTDYYVEDLNEQVTARKCNLVELESQWDAIRNSLEEEKRGLEESLCATTPEALEKLQKSKEVELEMQSILSEIRKREEQHSKLSADLEKQPQLTSRRSYIERIKEITKNSRKQDADIERILKETRELQLESNSIQERLHRTYAVLDEVVFREAKKDPVGRQAYRLLTSIHESFEQISEKIIATDRIRREVAERESKLTAMASRSLNIDKLQADLDSIVKENEFLEQRLKNN